MIMLNQNFSIVDRETTAIVEIVVDESGKLWVNVDEKCLLRVKDVKMLSISVEDSDPDSIIQYVRTKLGGEGK